MIEETRGDDPERIRKREGWPRIARDEERGGLREEVRQVIEKTVKQPSFTRSSKCVDCLGGTELAVREGEGEERIAS
jgi:hypothetical protein